MGRLLSNTFRNFSSERPAAFWALVLLISSVFVLGGSARYDPQSLVILRPLAIFFLAFGLWGLKVKHLDSYRFLASVGAASVLLAVLHLIPMPADVLTGIQNRNLILEIDAVAGATGMWRPISYVPNAVWNALDSMVAPIAVFVLAIQVDRESRFKLLQLLLFWGIISALLGLFQAVGTPGGGLYFYRLTNGTVPVGLFANRNHFAIFCCCLFLMLAVYLSVDKTPKDMKKFKLWIVLAFGAFLIPLILISGSRAGFLFAILALLTTPLLYRNSTTHQKNKDVPIWRNGSTIFAIGISLLMLATLLASRAAAFERLFDDGGSADVRYSTWKPIWEMLSAYFPLGSGIGSFAAVYQIDEMIELLTFQYTPHAHNEVLEVLLVSGIFGATLILIAFLGLLLAAIRHFITNTDMSRTTIFGRLGTAMIIVLGAASFVDFPLRTPALLCVLTVAAIWASGDKKLPTKYVGSS
jgi:O-antigen ligase